MPGRHSSWTSPIGGWPVRGADHHRWKQGADRGHRHGMAVCAASEMLVPQAAEHSCQGQEKEPERMPRTGKIYQAKSRTEAVARFREWVARWEHEEPKAVACLVGDIEELLAIFGIPEEHRIKVRTTNMIERVFREVRRRTRPMNCFTNRRSVDRMLYAILTRQNKLWKEGRPLPNFTH